MKSNRLPLKIIVLSVALFFSVGVSACSKNSSDSAKTKEVKSENDSVIKFEKDGELTFTTKSGDYITQIDIEIADTNPKRMQGLMFRESMKENRGMLFIFPTEEFQSFWMKNTVIPLDMIFVNAKREIVNIHKNTTPYSEQTYPSTSPSKYVVEVNAGFTDNYNIKPGDKIVWRIVR